MKLTGTCKHLADEEVVDPKEFMSISTDGKFFVIQQMCQDCFIEQAMPIMRDDLPVEMWDGRQSTVGEIARESASAPRNRPRTLQSRYEAPRGIVSG